MIKRQNKNYEGQLATKSIELQSQIQNENELISFLKISKKQIKKKEMSNEKWDV